MRPASFHPAVEAWFRERFDGPTDAQSRAWPEIQAGRDTLLSAPTGSGKTLAAFLVCIDQLERLAEADELRDEIQVVYVSPLKALSSDIRRNLEEPLVGIDAAAEKLGLKRGLIRTALRTGDTSPRDRALVIKNPPHILITTPESLYLMLTAERSRELLRSARTVIVDEIHALLRDKRGSHLALSLARLDHVAGRRLQRIGLSATVHPIELAARFLVGTNPGDGPLPCTIVQLDARRDLDLAIDVPPTDLEAVCSHAQWRDIYDRIGALIQEHRSTLVFVNTRARAERIAHHLEERVGAENVASHHGSLSKDRRLQLEERLKAGKLRALVATASLELGIDIGSVDLVCQVESPRSVSTFLQRIGRSGHALNRQPKGRLFPTTRDELVECTALLKAIAEGRLDRVHPPEAPLDILSQQIVAECAAEPWPIDALFDLMRRALPFSHLERAHFDEIVEMLTEGIPVGLGRAAELLHHDRVNRILHGRRGARRTAIESGGAIPDNADYRVLAEPDNTFVGTINEDFAVESQAGDIFLLGSTSWQIRKMEPGVARVVDAQGAPPTIPFWLGEAPSRTPELSAEVSALRAAWLEHGALAFRADSAGIVPDAAIEQLDLYFRAESTALGLLPTQRDIVYERFFDDSGGMQIVVHAPFGGRLNRAFGLALRKRFCRTFDFELQAAANDDAILLSLGAHQSFPLSSVFGLLRSDSVEQVLCQAALASPMFGTRWRWNASRALALLRQKHGKRVPPPIQRMRADDLMARVFPAHAACQENVTGPIEVPEHPLVRQTMHDCLREAMDLDGLLEVVRGMESGSIRLHARDTSEPSPFSHEMLTSKPWSYLDDAPLEERRARAVTLRRTLPEEARELAALDPNAIRVVIEEAKPEPRNAEELHELLYDFVALDPSMVETRGWGLLDDWREHFRELIARGRAAQVEVDGRSLWFVAERARTLRQLWPAIDASFERRWDESVLGPVVDEEAALRAIARGYLDYLGPITTDELADVTGITPGRIHIALAALESEGTILRGSFRPGAREEFCDRGLLARIHRMTLDRLRREIEPVSAQDFLRFLLEWQHVAPSTLLPSRRGLLDAVTQLAGFEAPARAWERSLLPARVQSYSESWLDELCLTGQVVWGRLSLPSLGDDARRNAASASTPITLAPRGDFALLMRGARNAAAPVPSIGLASEIHALLERRGALFLEDIARELNRLKTEVERALWELVAGGLVAADGFQALRTLMKPEGMGERAGFERRLRRLKRRGLAPTVVMPAGRWSLLHDSARDSAHDAEEVAARWADQLLRRYGVVFRDVVRRESFVVPWREILRVLRRREARGEVRGGRFVAGFHGEQYALPEAIPLLRQTRRRERSGEEIVLSAVDPLNLAGYLTPGARIAALTRRRVHFLDGIPSEVESEQGKRAASGQRDRGAAIKPLR